MQVDLVAQGAHQHFAEFHHQRVQVQALRLQALLAREGQQLLGELAGLFAGQAGAVDGLADGGAVVEVGCRQFQVAGHHLQQVVEVVGQAGGQLADRLHLLRLQVGLLGDAAARDVHL